MIANPAFSVDPHGDWIWGNEWLPNGSVTVTIGAFSATLPTDDGGKTWQKLTAGLPDGELGRRPDVEDDHLCAASRFST